MAKQGPLRVRTRTPSTMISSLRMQESQDAYESQESQDARDVQDATSTTTYEEVSTGNAGDAVDPMFGHDSNTTYDTEVLESEDIALMGDLPEPLHESHEGEMGHSCGSLLPALQQDNSTTSMVSSFRLTHGTVRSVQWIDEDAIFASLDQGEQEPVQ